MPDLAEGVRIYQTVEFGRAFETEARAESHCYWHHGKFFM